MKSLPFKIIIPLTIISFAIFTKWWYALPIDAPDTMFKGFPFPFVCEGWHTSMSIQIFITEFVLDFLVYLLIWCLFFYCFQRFVKTLKMYKGVNIILWTLSGFILAFATMLIINKNNLFYLKRPFKMEIMETGFQFGWQHKERPDFYKYHPETKRNK